MLEKLYAYRFTFLLVSLILVLLAPAFAGLSPHLVWFENVLQLLVLLASLNVIRKMKKWVIVLVVLAFLGTASDFLSEMRTITDQAKLISLGLVTVFASIITFELFLQVSRGKVITAEILVGAVSGYLMMAFIGSLIYLFLYLVVPDAFQGLSQGVAVTTDLTYFSFITQLTIGYGDIVPIHATTRTVTVLQGLIGHFYSLIVIAVLISKYLHQNASDPA